MQAPFSAGSTSSSPLTPPWWASRLQEQFHDVEDDHTFTLHDLQERLPGGMAQCIPMPTSTHILREDFLAELIISLVLSLQREAC